MKMKDKVKELLLKITPIVIISGIMSYIAVSYIGMGARLNEQLDDINKKVLQLERTKFKLEIILYEYANRLDEIILLHTTNNTPLIENEHAVK